MARNKNFIVKLTGISDRDGKGEYPGGSTLTAARREAAHFAKHRPAARVSIVMPVPGDEERLELVEVYSEGTPGAMPSAADDDEAHDEYIEYFTRLLKNGYSIGTVKSGTRPHHAAQIIYLFDIDEEERERFPFLRGRDRVAFTKTKRGKLVEVEVPHGHERERLPGESASGGPEIADHDYVIQDRRRGGFEVFQHGHMVESTKSTDFEDILEYVKAHAKRENFYPNLWYVNERGNTDMLDYEGNIVRSWV
jgi:hypothetical protein